MYIKELKLRNFRNYDSCSIQFHKNINIILGENAQGKTNILESLIFLSSTRSHRLQYDQQMIKENKECCNIDCIYFDERDKKISAVIHQRGKTLLLNQLPILKSSEFIGKLNVVLFSPSDLEVFDDSPKERRRLIDVEIGKVSPQYMVHLSKYIKLLKERNTLLKSNRIDDSYLEVLENQMIEAQVAILKERKIFINEINKIISSVYTKLSGQNYVVKCNYISCVEINTDEEMRKNLRLMIERNKDKDIQYKITSCGIHRDDINFEIDNKKVEVFASQGQKRMVILSLKLSLLEYIKTTIGKTPVLLLDDVMSELDHERRKNLLKIIPSDIQTIITTTDLVDCLSELNIKPHVIKVVEGNVKTMEVVQ